MIPTEPFQQNTASASFWKRAQTMSNRMLVWALIATAFITPISTAAMNLGFAVMVLLFVLAGQYRERLQVVKDSPVACVTLAMFAFICLGAAWTVGPIDEAKWQIAKYSKLLLMPLVMCVAQSSRVRVAVLVALLVSLLLTMMLSYVNAIHPLPAWLSRATREGVLSGNSYIFKHHIIQNVFLSFATLLCVVMAFSQERKINRWMLLGSGMACAGSVMFLAQGRTGYLTLLAVVLMLFWLIVRRHPQWLKYSLAAIAVAAVGITASPVFQGRIAETITSYNDYTQKGSANAIGHRLLFWNTSIEIIRERPLFGAGTGAYKQEFLKRVSDPSFTNYGAYNPHNQYLFFGTQLGIAGMFAFLLMLMTFWVSARRLPWQRQALARGTVLILAIYCMFDSPIFITEGYFWMVLLGTLWAGIHWSTKKQLPHERFA